MTEDRRRPKAPQVPLPEFTRLTKGTPVFEFTHRGLELYTYRPVGFVDGAPVDYGWSVFRDLSEESRVEVTGGWNGRARAVRAALGELDAGLAGERVPGARCCAHLNSEHVPGRYTEVRCAVRGCPCVMFARGPVVEMRAQDIPVGARFGTGVPDYVERVVQERFEDYSTMPGGVRSPLVGLRLADGNDWRFVPDAKLYVSVDTIPADNPRL